MFLFKDRSDAGQKLGQYLKDRNLSFHDPIVLGIARGGIAVGRPVAKIFSCGLFPLTLRKLPLPDDDQMGFGVVTIDQKVILNEDIVQRGFIQRQDIDEIIDDVYKEVLRRDRLYRQDAPFPDLAGRSVIIVDDELATGYTMLGAVSFARERGTKDIVIAVPVAHKDAINNLKDDVRAIATLHESDENPFAIASFYRDFRDLTDAETVELLEKAHKHEKRSHAV